MVKMMIILNNNLLCQLHCHRSHLLNMEETKDLEDNKESHHPLTLIHTNKFEFSFQLFYYNYF